MGTIYEKIGINIRNLRKAHGHTQLELGRLLFMEDNTISMYESGKRTPPLEILQKIATLYSSSIDQLIRADFSKLNFSNLTFTIESIAETLEVLFPLSVSDEALEDSHFVKGYECSKKIMEALKNCENIMRVTFEKALEAYTQSIEDSEIKEAAANILWLIFVLFALPQDEQSIKLGSDLLSGKISGAEFAIKNNSRDIIERKKSYARDFNECIIECMKILKESPKHSTLADYFLALRYIIGMVDTDYEQDLNEKIGMEMMLSLLVLGNSYAFRYVDNALNT